MDGNSSFISDDFDFGSYAPSIAVNSRSGSMKYNHPLYPLES